MKFLISPIKLGGVHFAGCVFQCDRCGKECGFKVFGVLMDCYAKCGIRCNEFGWP